MTESELADSITDPGAREAMRTYRAVTIPSEAVARAISFSFTLDQPTDVDVNEIVVRPTAQR